MTTVGVTSAGLNLTLPMLRLLSSKAHERKDSFFYFYKKIFYKVFFYFSNI